MLVIINYLIKKFMKFFSLMSMAVMLVGCAEIALDGVKENDGVEEVGLMSVELRYDDQLAKSVTKSVEILEDEVKVNTIGILVFDKSTKVLNAFSEIKSMSEKCQMSLPVGEKVVYAVVNGPSLSNVKKIADIDALVDDLRSVDMSAKGLALIGKQDCKVVAGSTPTGVSVTVRWLVSRVVLNKVECNLPVQYGQLTVESVFLGNAYAKQTFAGVMSDAVNVKGLNVVGSAIGIQGVKGECSSYMFRSVGKVAASGKPLEQSYYMYCQPNNTETYTCLYLVAVIEGTQYYYRVPLNKKLQANSSYSVDLKITNIGSLTPPDGDMQKGDIQAVVTVAGWTAGNNYTAEF